MARSDNVTGLELWMASAEHRVAISHRGHVDRLLRRIRREVILVLPVPLKTYITEVRVGYLSTRDQDYDNARSSLFGSANVALIPPVDGVSSIG